MTRGLTHAVCGYRRGLPFMIARWLTPDFPSCNTGCVSSITRIVNASNMVSVKEQQSNLFLLAGEPTRRRLENAKNEAEGGHKYARWRVQEHGVSIVRKSRKATRSPPTPLPRASASARNVVAHKRSFFRCLTRPPRRPASSMAERRPDENTGEVNGWPHVKIGFHYKARRVVKRPPRGGRTRSARQTKANARTTAKSNELTTWHSL